MILAGLVACPIGCGSSPYRSLQSSDPHARVDAIRKVAAARDRRATPLLVPYLEDDDADMRLFAVQALREITGENFGYRYYECERDRQPAVERWRQWLGRQGDRREAGRGE